MTGDAKYKSWIISITKDDSFAMSLYCLDKMKELEEYVSNNYKYDGGKCED
jgi:hypothetical protein